MIELTKGLLSKFTGLNNKSVSGTILPPADLSSEQQALRDLVPGLLFTSSSGAKCFSYEFGQSSYLAIPIYLSDEHSHALTLESQNEILADRPIGSHFLYLADKLSLLPRKICPNWVEENIVGPAQADGVDLEVIRECMQPLSVFKIFPSHLLLSSLPSPYIADYICTFETDLCASTSIHSDSVQIIRELFLSEKLHFFGENLFHALAAASLRHSFLEAYKLLEFTFILPRADDLINTLNEHGSSLNLSLIEFAKQCSNKLGWRRQERDSIGRIFRDYADHDLSAFINLAGSCEPFRSIDTVPNLGDPTEKVNIFVQKLADRFYDLRNQVVHQLWPDDEFNCKPVDWNALILFTLQCVRWVYDKHLLAVSQYCENA
jgi:hypothetical protein